jgi:hypothetical protein
MRLLFGRGARGWGRYWLGPNTAVVYHAHKTMLSRRWPSVAGFILLVLLIDLASLLALARAGDAVGAGARYNLPLWVGRNLARTWLNGPSRALGGGTSAADDGDLLAFFDQASRVASLERDLAYEDAAGRSAGTLDQQLEAGLIRARRLGRPVEIRLAAELTRAATGAGLSTRLPIYRRVAIVWPPVSFAYDYPPLVLARSPRDRIVLDEATLLRGDLTRAQIGGLETSAQRGGESALIVRIGGLAAYPSLVEDDDNYNDGLEVIAHEWTHQYLAFHPLGLRYFVSPAMTTLNETVANLVSIELAQRVRAEAGAPPAVTPVRSATPSPDPTVDFDRTMHQLRLDVDSLLAQGKIDEAEQHMDSTQQYLIDHGYDVSTINQAYFAFYGTYANTAASSSPIGAELAVLRTHYADLTEFVHVVQDLRTIEDLQRLLKTSAG